VRARSKGTSCFGHRKAARVAFNKARADPILECSKGSCHGGRRSSQPTRRSGETAVVDHRDQYRELLEPVHFDYSILRNSDFLIVRLCQRFCK